MKPRPSLTVSLVTTTSDYVPTLAVIFFCGLNENKQIIDKYFFHLYHSSQRTVFSDNILFYLDAAVDVGIELVVASFDTISEVNMVSCI